MGGWVCLKNHIHLAELIIEMKSSDIIKNHTEKQIMYSEIKTFVCVYAMRGR